MKQLHYGTARMQIGSILNWQGTRYSVISVQHELARTELIRLEHTAYYHHVTTDNSVYTLRGSHGAVYTVRHEGGYISAPKRIKDTIVGNDQAFSIGDIVLSFCIRYRVKQVYVNGQLRLREIGDKTGMHDMDANPEECTKV